MKENFSAARPPIASHRKVAERLGLCLLLGHFLAGCAAVSNPVADGIPPNRLPPDLLAEPKGNRQTIPLSCLGQDTPKTYLLDAGDTIGVWIDGVLGENNAPPITQSSTGIISNREQQRVPPAVGYPITVKDDGTIALPLVDSIPVRGMSIEQAQEAIRVAYVKKDVLKAGKEKILVSLLTPRQYQIVVMRQEFTSSTTGSEGFASTSKRGTGHQVFLPAYENDLLHALAQTGGLPGLDAVNEISIFRKCPGGGSCNPAEKAAALRGPVDAHVMASLGARPAIRIPMRWKIGQPMPFKPEDIILENGDVVLIEARDDEVYFTSGLLPSGEHVLPRDVDLDVIEAICRVRGPLANGAVAVSNLSGTLIDQGIGNPSPALLTVLRKVPSGGQVAIRVDLNRALRDPRERILVKAGDVLLLQEKPGDAMTRYFSQTLFNFELAYRAINTRFAQGFIQVSAPNRSGTRFFNTNFSSID